jgi:hypothetical protein
MNLILKSAVGATLALAAVGANALGVPASNSSDLVLVIQNQTTPANVYVLDTGISITSALGAGSLVANATLNSTAFAGINQTIAASSTLTSFLAANPAAGDGWALEAGQYSGSTTNASPVNAASKAAGKAYGIFSSASSSGAVVSNVQLAGFQNFLGGVQGDLLAPTDSLGLSPIRTASEASTGASYVVGSGNAQGKYGVVGGNDTAALGASTTLFALTGNGTTGTVQSYTLGTATLSTSGQLVLAGNGGTAPPPIPLPPAVWLFGSGLLGLVGVSRRRKTAV